MLMSDIRLGPGIYDGLDDEVYHGDCCAGPSISSTGIREVLRDPAEYWAKSTLNPEVKAAKALALTEARAKGEAPKARHFDKGKAAHLMLLEPERVQDNVTVIPEDMLSSNGAISRKDAKAFAAEQSALGRAVLKPSEWDHICDMAEALAAHPAVTELIDGCAIEQSHIWQDEQTGVFLKSRPDLTPPSADRFIVDYKSTDVADIEQWGKKATVDHRLDIQAALQLWGVYEAHGFMCPGVCYIIQNFETQRIAIRPIRLNRDEARDMIEAAKLDLRAGINLFADCWERNHWPSNWDKITDLVPPEFRQRQIERQITESAAAFSAGYAA